MDDRRHLLMKVQRKQSNSPLKRPEVCHCFLRTTGRLLYSNNNVNEISLRNSSLGELLTSQWLNRVSDFEDLLMLWPEIIHIVASTRAKRDEVVYFKGTSLLRIDSITSSAIVLDD